MDTMGWDEDLATGNEAVDEQHRELFAMFSEVHDALSANDDALPVSDVIARLQEYALHHFHAEENLMSRSGMSGDDVVAHLREHRDLRDQIERLASADPPVVSVRLKLVALMHRWLTHHIDVYDRDLARHVREHEG